MATYQELLDEFKGIQSKEGLTTMAEKEINHVLTQIRQEDNPTPPAKIVRDKIVGESLKPLFERLSSLSALIRAAATAESSQDLRPHAIKSDDLEIAIEIVRSVKATWKTALGL